ESEPYGSQRAWIWPKSFLRFILLWSDQLQTRPNGCRNCWVGIRSGAFDVLIVGCWHIARYLCPEMESKTRRLILESRVGWLQRTARRVEGWSDHCIRLKSSSLSPV